MREQKLAKIVALAVLLILLGNLCGCQAVGDFLKTGRRRFFSPEKVIDAPSRSSINPIYHSIGVADTHQEMVPNATLPSLEDLTYSETDYRIGPTDMLDISILDLFSEGAETVLRRQVSDSGFIDLPLLKDRLLTKELTKEELREKVIQAYKESLVLRDPTVSVTILSRRQSIFSIRGAVARPGTYNIVRKDMRMMEALAMAGDIVQPNIRYIIVIRPDSAVRKLKEPEAENGERPLPPLPEIPDEIPATGPATTGVPATRDTNVEDVIKEFSPVIERATQPSTIPKPSAVPYLTETSVGSATSGATTVEDPELREAASKAYKWVYTNGRWIRVAQEAPVATKPSGRDAPPVRPAGEKPRTQLATDRRPEDSDPFGWQKMDKSDLARIIAINLRKLNQGDPRMNIVIRDNDIIQVPTLEVGEFYIMGEVLRPGVYSLTGRRITVKQALAAAGNLAPLAWPENSILIRRVGDNQEQIIALDVDAICHGKRPDLYLKPNDVLAIGTDVRAQFYAVMRNAFRMTYGFGFIWDRNFSDPMFIGRTGYNSRRFTRW